MKRNKDNPYGYKVCYKEENSKRYIRYFKTYTYKQAIKAKCGYIRFPPKNRENGGALHNPKWVVIPIKYSEVKDGIWLEDPFRVGRAFLFYTKNIIKSKGEKQ